MRKGSFVALVAAALLGIVGWSSAHSAGTGVPADAPVGGSIGFSGGIITHHLPGATSDQVVVIDPATRTMAVYRIAKDRGQIALSSVRRIDADLKLLSFNTERPLPEEVAAGLERQNY